MKGDPEGEDDEMSETAHEHTWRQATDRELDGYCDFSDVSRPSPQKMRLDRCSGCKSFRVATFPGTDQETVRQIDYKSSD